MRPSMLSQAKEALKGAIKDVVLWGVLPWAYRRHARRPVDAGSVLFLERKLAELPDSFKELHGRLSADPARRVGFLSLGYGRAGVVEYYLNCLRAVKAVARAEVVFLDDASDVISCLPLRPETKVVQLWHACGAFKKWGMSTADLLFGGSRADKKRHPFYENLSLVTVSSPEVVWAYAEAMDLEGREDIIKPLGVSRTDVFFQDGFVASARSAVEEAVPACAGKKVLLYAPTFRGKANEAVGPDALDVAALKRALGGEWVLLVKHHPFVAKRPEVPEGCRDFAFDVSAALPIDKLLCRADACVSDYSSLVFEYSLLGRPMAFFAYDKDDYDDWRGFYYDYDELTPGPVFSRNEDLVDYLAHVDERFDADRVRLFRDRFMSACDGRATERIIGEVFGDGALPSFDPQE